MGLARQPQKAPRAHSKKGELKLDSEGEGRTGSVRMPSEGTGEEEAACNTSAGSGAGK